MYAVVTYENLYWMKVLLVEDDPALQQSVQYLTGEGYTITPPTTYLQMAQKTHDYDFSYGDK